VLEDFGMEKEGRASEAMATVLNNDNTKPQTMAPDDISRVDMANKPGGNRPEEDSLPNSDEDLEPGFAHIDGDVDGTGYNDTKVDVIAVPCPGADPVQTWTYDPLPEDYFGAPSQSNLRKLPTVAKLAADTILSPAIDRPLPKAGQMWVRQGIRRSANTARVMLYRHRALTDETTLERLARDLLDQVQQKRQGTVSEALCCTRGLRPC